MNEENKKGATKLAVTFGQTAGGLFFQREPLTVAKNSGRNLEEENRDLMYRAKQLEAVVADQDKMLKTLTASPYLFGVILNTVGDLATAFFNGTVQQIRFGGSVRLEPGDIVRINGQSGALSGLVEEQTHFVGAIADVKSVNGTAVEINDRQDTRLVVGRLTLELQKGDRVILDDSGRVVVRKLPKPPAELAYSLETNVSWDDIAGLEEAKRDIREAIELPITHAELYKRFDEQPPKGILIYGPPGCGKTMLGKAVATSIAKAHGSKAKTGFILVKGPEILNKWVGESESAVRRMFTAARDHKEQHGYPAIIFIDEAEAILRSRDNQSQIGLTQTLVPMFLAEMDGVQASGAIVVLATNRPTDLDPAIVRAGRIDRKIRIGRPSEQTAANILGMGLKKAACAVDSTVLAEHGAARLFEDDRVVYNILLRSGETKNLCMSHLVYGGMVDGIAKKARKTAIRRNMVTPDGGIHFGDIDLAVDEMTKEVYDLDNMGVVEELVEDVSQIVKVTKVPREVPTSSLIVAP